MSRLFSILFISLLCASLSYADIYTGSGQHPNSAQACLNAANLIARRALPDPEVNPNEKPLFLPSYSILVNKPTESSDVCTLTIDTSAIKAPTVKQVSFKTKVRSISRKGVIDAESNSMLDSILACSKANSYPYEPVVKRFEPIHSVSLDAYFTEGYTTITREITCALTSITLKDEDETTGFGDTEAAACADSERLAGENFNKRCAGDYLNLRSIDHRNLRTSFLQSRGNWACAAIYTGVCKI
jgi:hypothetical protein